VFFHSHREGLVLAETVTLVNRTKGPLKATYDGQDIPIQPGLNHGFPAVAVSFAKAQNRVMGSTHPYSPTSFESLVGVQGTTDPVTPIEQSDAIEIYDRSKFGGLAEQAVRVPGQPVTAWEARAGMQEIDNDAVGAH
jgi:hypothetical protein